MNTYRMLVEKMFKVKAMEELEMQQVEIIAVEEYDSNSLVITYKTSEQAQTFIARNLPECRFAYVEEEVDRCDEETSKHEPVMNNLLNSMLENTMEGTLKHDVAEIILDQLDEADDNEILTTFEDIFTYGCVSGAVNALITYKDTAKFFDNHSDEIFELVEDMKQEGLIDMNNFELSKNNLAWFAFETIAQEIYQELEYAAGF